MACTLGVTIEANRVPSVRSPNCIVLGPGNTLGGATAQAMLACDWHGMSTKADFSERQASDPYLLAMGHSAQRGLVTSG